MNLTKALKAKKKLVKQVDEFYNRFANSNSKEQDTVSVYDAEESYEKWIEATNELILLKTKIQLANAPIAHKIFKLGELKSQAAKLKRVDTKEGIQRDRYSDKAITYTAWMKQLAKDEMIEELEEQIETLQEEIEAFNALTKI